MLPPTVNDLAPSQRQRLVRSTRKLQAVLGATPQLVESSYPARNPKNLALTLAPHPTHPNRPLVLTLSGAPGQHLHISGSRSRSNSAAERPPLSPVTPTTNRRRRMAKLTRTLGENIPPELVSTTRRRSNSTTLPERKSIPQFDSPPTPRASSDESEESAEMDDKVLPTLPDIKETDEAHALTHTVSLPTPPTPTLRPSMSLRQRLKHKRSATGSGWGHRRELGWSGEWNEQDHEEILKRLRELK